MSHEKKDKLIIRIFYLVIGGLCGIFMILANPAMLDLEVRDFAFSMAISLLCLLLAYFVQIIFHELGHLVFGLLTGYSFVSFRVGSIMLVKENDSFSIKFFSVMGTGGQCLLMPPVWSEKLPFRLYNMGGCIMNFITALIATAIFIIMPKEGYLSVFVVMLGILGFGNVLINGIPLQANGISNDGRNAFFLGKSEESLRAFWLQLYVNGLLTKGERMKNMPKEWFFLPQGEAQNDPIICSVGVMKYNRDFDAHDFETAEYDIEYLLKIPSLLGLYRNELTCELIFLRVLRGAPMEDIDGIFTPEILRYIKATSGYASRRRLLYAYHLLYKNNLALAERELENCKRVLKNVSDAEAASEREILEIIKEKAKLI